MEAVVLVGVVAIRFVLPLLILRYPLPAIVACLVVDGVDQTVFQALGHDPPGYQSYDKAMDVWYLAIAYIATLRNWTSRPAFLVAWVLYFSRLVGVLVFEVTQARVVLLLVPNTFEYFFIAYEAMRTRWDPQRFGVRAWILVAAGIWVVVKLPQEYWIHVARLDVTDVLGARPWVGAVLAVLLVALAVWWWSVGRARLAPPDWPPRLVTDPLPEEIDTAAEQAAWRAATTRVLSRATGEKMLLLGLLAVVFAHTLPGVRATDLDLFVNVSFYVLANAAIQLAASRRALSIESLWWSFGARVLLNVALVVVATVLTGDRGGSYDTGSLLFYVVMVSALTSLHDRYQPVRVFRDAATRAAH